MIESEKILEIVKKIEPKMIADRRYLHINAEISGEEYETAAYIVSEMQALGLEPLWAKEHVSPYFVFDTGKKGSLVSSHRSGREQQVSVLCAAHADEHFAVGLPALVSQTFQSTFVTGQFTV